MAGPLVIKYTTDASQVDTALDHVDKAHAGLAGKLGATGNAIKGSLVPAAGAFGLLKGSLGELAGGFDPLIDGLGKAGPGLEHVKEKFSDLEGVSQKTGAALVGAGAGLTALGAIGVAAGEKQEQAAKTLEVAIKDAGGSYEDYAGRIDKAVAAGERNSHGAADTKDAIAKLTTAYGDAGKALDSMGLVDEVAAKKHISLSEAADQVLKIHQGSSKVLKQYGIDVTATTGAHKELEAATKAVEAADTKSAVASQKLSDVKALLAGKSHLTVAETITLRNATAADADAAAASDAAHKRLAEAQTANADATGKGSYETQVLARIHGTAAAQADTFGARLGALKTHVTDVAGELGAKFGPALTQAGPLIMGVGAILETGMIPKLLSMGVTAGTTAVAWGIDMATMLASTIAANAGIILATGGIVLAVAAIAIGIYELWSHWGQVWGFIKDVAHDAWDFIKRHIDLIVGLFAPFLLPIVLVAQHWKKIWGDVKKDFSDAWDGIKSIAGSVADFFTGVWGGIEGAIKTGINAVIDLVNSGIQGVANIANTMLGLASHIPGLSSVLPKSITLPLIPKLAGGGTALEAGLALVGEKGPELLALPKAASVVPLPPDQLGMSGGGQAAASFGTITIQLDRQVLAEVTYDELLRTGRQNVTVGLS